MGSLCVGVSSGALLWCYPGWLNVCDFYSKDLQVRISPYLFLKVYQITDVNLSFTWVSIFSVKKKKCSLEVLALELNKPFSFPRHSM